MRPRVRWQAILVVAAFGCARPVLYYPAPETTANPRPTPGPAAPTTPEPAPSRGENLPVLATAAMVYSTAADLDYLRSRSLVVPVAGADMTHVENSFGDARDGERVHRAIDILAPRGTPVLSADDGKILRMTTSQLGGISMYTVDPQSRLVYYYAHMDRYNRGMSIGRTIARGDTLGYVGTTGNAPKDTPHLHFQVMRWPADGRYWNGEPINPYDALGGSSHGDRTHASVAPAPHSVAGRVRPE